LSIEVLPLFTTFSAMLSLPCPAKINLFLEVRGRRADGFHELGTLFQAVETGDTLRAEPWDAFALAGAEGVTANPDDNLVVRAARLLQARYPDRLPPGAGIRFTLEKRLPSGAGLGGGSSDAAAALRLADALWKLDLSLDELRAHGAALGSDVPFFLATPSAFAEGRGEELTPAPAPHPFHVVIATPKCHVETPWAYRQLAAHRTQFQDGRFGIRWDSFRREYARHAGEPEFYRALHNDFEEPVTAHFPEIRAVQGILDGHSPIKTMLSGSGASVFALFETAGRAGEALAAVSPHCRFAVTTGFLTRFQDVGPGG
jgi:4-diphosphocytidyl-2-C-methyl-D-erythritol kinase